MAISHVFHCDRCPTEAGRVTLYGRGEMIPSRGAGEVDQVTTQVANTSAGQPRLEALSPVGNVTVFEFDAGAALAAVGAGEVRSLYGLDPEFPPLTGS